MTRHQQILLGISAWCLLTALPGALAAVGVFGDFAVEDEVPGRVIAVRSGCASIPATPGGTRSTPAPRAGRVASP